MSDGSVAEALIPSTAATRRPLLCGVQVLPPLTVLNTPPSEAA
jgi:hypothetical protein